MAYRRRRKSSGTKGKHCVRRKRVRVRGQGMALRCAKYSGGRSRTTGGYRKRRPAARKARGMAKRGSHCIRFKRVHVRGIRGSVRRCAKYGR